MQVQVLSGAPKQKTPFWVFFCFADNLEGLEGSVLNDCRWQSEPTTASPAGEQVLSGAPEKDLNFDKKLRSFSTKSVLRRDKSALQMKSLRDEILLRKDNRRI